ncbi:HDOD domain-containing protein [Thiohalobacter sp. IOR34]|uniref:HDOD domain-containing protein n=1 Tax=Thiohalobacter sp. IOR34 TaxID=3057176 RepID=UPI0025B1A5CE|nr:HDOD domain-containing protein [Thiohalobacter sp. IOR34]WJW76333.1 HDOD domain-containing protein [Thiohalobacter sp. IOR34]
MVEETAVTAEKTPRNLAEWVEVIGERGMPVFARTIEQISGVASDGESSASELARVVLQDAAMTARLLRIANSPLYNLAGKRISTVSRAVVMLGFDTVRSLCLSIAVVESVARGAQKARLAEHMARCFHAAVQARSFAERRGDESPEEVFIATLLCKLGQLAFWSLDTPLAKALDQALSRPAVDTDQVSRELLGFEFSELSLGLSRQWRLGELLLHTLEDKADDDPRVGNVLVAHELAEQAEAGWESPEMERLLGRIAENLYLPLAEVKSLVHDNASQAARVAACFGAGSAMELIPLPAREGGGRLAAATAEVEASPLPMPDPALQLGILRELASLVEGRFDINLMLEMVLEGLHRGVGMDRALFALLTADRSRLRARYALGREHETLSRGFNFEISPVKAHAFFHVLDSREPLWIHPQADPRLLGLVTPEVTAVSGGAPFFSMPIVVNGKAIGLFYADRLPSRRDLGEDDYAAFRHFGQQANMALAYSRR